MVTAQAVRVEVVPLTAAMAEEIADLYARIFAGPPWYEIKRCANCEETYGKEDDLERFHDGDPCRRCGHPLTLLDYWRGERALEVYRDALKRPGFVGVGGRSQDGRLVAFSWGFAVPDEDTPSVRFSAVGAMLGKAGLERARTFYAAETGVHPDFQHYGIGSQVSFARLRMVQDAGYKTVCFRTINPKMLHVFERFFGPGNVATLFGDPDPVKSNRLWYAAWLVNLQELVPSAATPASSVSSKQYSTEIVAARFGEYRLIVEDLISLSARRQTTNQVFVALNSLFLTALGALLLSTVPLTVRTSIILGGLSVFALIINGAWWRSLGLYRAVYRVESGYAEGIERFLRTTGMYQEVNLSAETVPFGFVSLLNARVYRGSTRMLARFERAMALTFMLAYPLIAIVVGALTYLTANSYLPPLP